MQGIIGSVPWSALVFLTLYMQLVGMTDFHASMLMCMFLGAYGLGTLIGGWVGDAAASRFPDHGRIAVTQFSEFIRIPISWLIVKASSFCTHPGTLTPTHTSMVCVSIMIMQAVCLCIV